MLHCTNISKILFVMAFLVGSLIAAEGALAQTSCLSASERAQKVYLDEFRRDPSRYAADLGNDTTKIAGLISSFIASDPNLLVALRQLVAHTNAEQRFGIGMGLAGAADRCASSQPGISSEISRYMRNFTDPSLKAGFLSREAPRQTLLPQRKTPVTAGAELIQGEFADKLADPFAEIATPSP